MAGKKAGRHSKRTPEAAKAICSALVRGSTRRAACGAAGISEDTFARWLESSADFADAVTRAECEAENQMAYELAHAARMDWRAAESWLKRRRRDEWGENVSVDIDKEISELLAQLANAG